MIVKEDLKVETITTAKRRRKDWQNGGKT